MREMIYLKNVSTLRLDHALCNGCGMCVKVCPHQVFSITGGKVQIINRDACMECGACALNCEKSALSVKAGVGCAAAIINGVLRNSEPVCGCSDSKTTACC